jgi:hypothetical protein
VRRGGEILDPLDRCSQVDLGGVDRLGPSTVGHLRLAEVNGQGKRMSQALLVRRRVAELWGFCGAGRSL